MHELSIAQSILDIIESQRAEREFVRCTAVKLKIGLLAAVDDEALRFAFECLTEETPHRGVSLAIEKSYPQAECACGRSFEVQDVVYLCPDCGSPFAALQGGDELDILCLEVEKE
ncbi:MAG TPA: hydrogenase maturation nickel metallochaperone HypA [Candidatus Glassbacteria bacterium]|nr:hydrogenase maturation nickel metallochaperone HypA [Candidatus Glassbacteria bacterium]